MDENRVLITALTRERVISVIALIAVTAIVVSQMSGLYVFQENAGASIWIIAALAGVYFLRAFTFRIEANDTGVKIRRFIITRDYEYARVEKVRMKKYRAKHDSNIWIYIDGKRKACFSDYCENAKMFINKVQQKGIAVEAV